jgi:hypothetical protein
VWRLRLSQPSDTDSPSDVSLEVCDWRSLKGLEHAIYVSPYEPFQQTDEKQRWAARSIPHWLSSSVMFLGAVPYAVIQAVVTSTQV